MTAMTSPRPLTGRMVLIALLVFWAVVGAVNAIFIFFALETWPGLSQQDAYKAGVGYNRVLDEARVQAAMGWRSGVDLGLDGKLTVRIADMSGTPLSGLSVTVNLKRPASAGEDVSVELTREADGAYRARVAPPLAGAWSVEIAAVHADSRRYRLTHEIRVKP